MTQSGTSKLSFACSKTIHLLGIGKTCASDVYFLLTAFREIGEQVRAIRYSEESTDADDKSPQTHSS
jgi:hypothetical protein